MEAVLPLFEEGIQLSGGFFFLLKSADNGNLVSGISLQAVCNRLIQLFRDAPEHAVLFPFNAGIDSDCCSLADSVNCLVHHCVAAGTGVQEGLQGRGGRPEQDSCAVDSRKDYRGVARVVTWSTFGLLVECRLLPVDYDNPKVAEWKEDARARAQDDIGLPAADMVGNLPAADGARS